MINKIIAGLKRDFPDKNVVCNPEDNPTEILCEIEPSNKHPEYSEATAYISSSLPHRHLKATETYKVKSGRLTLYLNGVSKTVSKGQAIVIKPEVIHWAEGDWTRVWVRSEPGWTMEDHLLVDKAVSAGGVIVRDRKIIFVKFPEGEGITFPKGHVKKGETYEQTALREVSEETGLRDLEVVKKLGIVTRPAIETDGKIVIKDIHLFLIKVVGEAMEEAEEQTEWLIMKDALKRLMPQEAEFLKAIKSELD